MLFVGACNNMNWSYTFDYTNGGEPDLRGQLHLMPPQPAAVSKGSSAAYRKGTLALENGRELDVALYHNPHTSAFMYLSEVPLTPQLGRLLRLPAHLLALDSLRMPGQFILGSFRTRVVQQAVASMFETPIWHALLEQADQDALASFPVLREGGKYGISEALCDVYRYLAEEILVDAHHVDDPAVPGYGRRTRIAVF